MHSYEDESLENCPVSVSQRVVGGKWSFVILYHLRSKTLRFGQLHRKMPQLTQATLSRQLRILEGHGLVARKVYSEVPPKVEYSLTAIGREFLPVLAALRDWGIKYNQFVEENPEYAKAEA